MKHNSTKMIDQSCLLNSIPYFDGICRITDPNKISSNLIECVQQLNDSDSRTQEGIVKEAVDLIVKSR